MRIVNQAWDNVTDYSIDPIHIELLAILRFTDIVPEHSISTFSSQKSQFTKDIGYSLISGSDLANGSFKKRICLLKKVQRRTQWTRMS